MAAMRMLCKDPDLPEGEVDLTRKLVTYIHKAAHERREVNHGFLSPLFIDAPNQPSPTDQDRAPYEKKIPDLQWAIYDDQEPDEEKYVKRYSVECKRLGLPSGGHTLNKEYITDGVLRFTKAAHSYARFYASGAMIGYVQSMTLDDILTAVNTVATRNFLSPIELSGDGWQEKNVTRLDQVLDRPEVPPTPFDLRHLWADLRKTRNAKEIGDQKSVGRDQ